MLSRTAASLYWMGRYVERAEFTARLVEATVRLDALSTTPAGEAAWASALMVIDADVVFAATGEKLTPRNVTRFLTLSTSNPGSVVSCLDKGRDNAKAVRTALTREAWATINRAWLLFHGRSSPGDTQATLNLVNEAQAETRGFEGAIGRMMRNPSSWFIRLGATMERADNTARLLDVKYHILLPEGEAIGGAVDRDQWTTILQTVSAVNAYRWLYREGLKPWFVTELLILRRELPRSLAASAEEVVQHLNALGKQTGFQGEADRLARLRHARLSHTKVSTIVEDGLHQYLENFIDENAALSKAIARQFRFD
ncbi:alpha-E domain-containing protein [Sphingomonas sp.]|uniref:alpha-E domain-containing protein n=1 Tax=Sphingomonas sp. TaxID=28214 RepID=UPI0025F154DE|nr:alpha-E domain-containing protein [Sphingomonas sp.]